MTGMPGAMASNTSASNNTSISTAPNSIPSTQSPNTSGNPLRKLVDKHVYLDLNNSYKHKHKVKECLQFIESVSDEFFVWIENKTFYILFIF